MTFITVEQGENASTDANDFAAIVNGSTTVTTRYGGDKLSVDQALSKIIVGEVEVYNAASTYSNIEDWVEYSGVVYRPLPSALPVGPEAFNAANRAVAQGFATADNTSYNSTTVGAYLDSIMVDDYAELRAIGSSTLPDGIHIQVAGFPDPWEIKTGTVTDNGGTLLVFSGDTGRYAESTSEHPTVDLFLADPTGVDDSYAACQAMVDSLIYLRFGPGTYSLSQSVQFTTGKNLIEGVYGETFLKVAGDFGALTPSGEIVSEVIKVTGITFTSANRAEGSGIYTDQDQYLSHWDISYCIFEHRLAYGIQANMVGCNITNCIFGFNTASASDNFKPIESIGEHSADPGTPLLPNANVISNNWIIRSSPGVNAAIQIRSGAQNIITENLIESCQATDAIILLEGDTYPKIHHNYFERAQAPAMLKITDEPGGAIVTLFVEFEHNLIQGSTSAEELLYVVDFDGCTSDAHTFIGNLLPSTQPELLAFVRDKDGGLDTFQGCYMAYGNFTTGSLSGTPYDGLGQFNLQNGTKIYTSGTTAQLGFMNSSGDLARTGYRSAARFQMARLATGVTADVEIGGTIVGEFDESATSGNTRFLLYDVASGGLQRVKVGANNSGPGGSGRALYINNL